MRKTTLFYSLFFTGYFIFAQLLTDKLNTYTPDDSLQQYHAAAGMVEFTSLQTESDVNPILAIYLAQIQSLTKKHLLPAGFTN
jgi:hypothetical protein